MDIELVLALVFFVGVPTWYHTSQAVKKGRNFFISLILSFIFICSVWIGFAGWAMSLGWAYNLIKGLGITWWIGTPLYFLIGCTTAILQVLFILFFGALMDNYSDKGIIKVGIKIPNFIKNFIKKF